MIIELIGPGGVGKSTVEPLLAERLGIAYYPGKKRHDFDGRPQSTMQLWSGRAWSVLHNPLLALAAIMAHNGPPAERIRFVLDICRRERAAARAARLGSGVVASGPVHALCMMSGGTDRDVTGILPHLTAADVYVRLHADPGEVTRRLAGRLGQTVDEMRTHEDWMKQYETASIRISRALRRPMLDVHADGSPAEVADEIAGQLTSLG
ncbi:MAG: hypothetical protein ACRDWS_13095 [Acidimicrobiia bacterium]